jgi:hypothetical protein
MMEVRTDTDGLASAYQVTEITAGGPPVLETGGNLLIGVITLPYAQILPLTSVAPESSATPSEKEPQSLQNRLASDMSENRLFRQLVERGLADLEQDRYRQIIKEKIASGGV